MGSLARRYRISLGVFVAGLILSGLTAFPLVAELRILASILGIENPSDYASLTGLRHWIAVVLYGLETSYARFPFLGYGTDWLAYAHLAIAVFFVRSFYRPLENDWVLKCGLVCCAGVVPLALIAGQFRGVPIPWRMLDSSFGILGAIPLVYCLRLSREMRAQMSPNA